jgi:hypothetical protein
VNSGAPEGCAFPVPHVVPIVTLIAQPLNSATYIINRVKEWSMIETYFNVFSQDNVVGWSDMPSCFRALVYKNARILSPNETYFIHDIDGIL